jgi:GNAT superfamily N-acetyltransferase
VSELDTSEPDDHGSSPPGDVTVREARQGDVPALLEMFTELAEYENLTHELRATPRALEDALFGVKPAAEAVIAERDGKEIGYALFFGTFSSFLATSGVWLEDLFVRPSARREGVGRALLAAVAAVAVRRGGGRLEWAALDWNEPALGFYRALGARTMPEWITHRLAAGDLERLAEAR